MVAISLPQIPSLLPPEVQWLLVVIYAILAWIYIFRVLEELDFLVGIAPQTSALKHQLEKAGWQDCLEITFDFPKVTRLEDLKKFVLKVKNKSADRPFYLDWEQCSLTNFDGRSRRLVQMVPGMITDLSRPQVLRLVAPQQTLEAELTAEDGLERNDQGQITIEAPLFSPKKLKKALEEDQKFYIFLVVSPLTYDRPGTPQPFLCEFHVAKLPWYQAIAWKPKKKKKKHPFALGEEAR
jgi:hypothetical protein